MQFEVESVEATEQGRNALPRVVESVTTKVVDVGGQVLGESLNYFLCEFSEVVALAPPNIGPFAVDEIELSLSISATGDFRIASSTGAAAIKVILRRRND